MRSQPNLQPARIETDGTRAPTPPRSAEARAAMGVAGKLLTRRARTEAELRRRLHEGGFDDGTVDEVALRLTELGLLDDRSFAGQWIEERARRKGLSAAVLLKELIDRGVEREVAQEAVAASGVDDEARARALAAAMVGKVSRLPLEKQAARLQQLLLRRGYDASVAVEAVRAVLPPEGWD